MCQFQCLDCGFHFIDFSQLLTDVCQFQPILVHFMPVRPRKRQNSLRIIRQENWCLKEDSFEANVLPIAQMATSSRTTVQIDAVWNQFCGARLRGPAAMLSYRDMPLGIVSQNSFVLTFMGYRTFIARYVAKWGQRTDVPGSVWN